LGPGVINWRDGKTNGLWDTADPLHTRNYGACFCARRSDLIAIGGADEHLDYLGHVCGPYELTFRLVNKGLREIWHDQVFLYHTWHPGSDGDFNYIGPHDGRHMSATALAVRETRRIMPLVENASIRGLREGRGLDLSVLVDPSYREAWTEAAVCRSPRFQLFKQKKAAPRLIMSLDQHNMVAYEGRYYGVPRELGPVDLEQESARQDPRIIHDANLETLKAAIDASLPEPAPRVPRSADPAAFRTNGADKSSGEHPLVLAAMAVLAPAEPTINGAGSIADFVAKTISQSQLKRDIVNQRLDRIEAEYERRNQLLRQLQAAGVEKDRLIATLQDRIAESEREREEMIREARHWRDHVLQFRAELELLPLLHRKEIAMDTGSGVLVLPTSEPGHFLFGPYLPLQAGQYTLAVRFRAAWVSRPKEPVLTIEIAAGENVLLSVAFAADASDFARLGFTVPAEADGEGNRVEFRFSHHANASLEIRDIRLSAAMHESREKYRPRSVAFPRLSQQLRLFHRAADRA
jgi:hypothetical protein